MGWREPRTATCEICGEEFLTRSPRAKYCPVCGYRKAKDDAREAHAAQRAEAKRARAAASEKRCLYCGGRNHVKDGYCHTCRYTGLANVHKTFGRSNGWELRERRKATKERVVDGWRGRPVAGGSAGNSIRFARMNRPVPIRSRKKR